MNTVLVLSVLASVIVHDSTSTDHVVTQTGAHSSSPRSYRRIIRESGQPDPVWQNTLLHDGFDSYQYTNPLIGDRDSFNYGAFYEDPNRSDDHGAGNMDYDSYSHANKDIKPYKKYHHKKRQHHFANNEQEGSQTRGHDTSKHHNHGPHHHNGGGHHHNNNNHHHNHNHHHHRSQRGHKIDSTSSSESGGDHSTMNDPGRYTASISTRPAVRQDDSEVVSGSVFSSPSMPHSLRVGTGSGGMNDDDTMPIQTAPAFDESISASVTAQLGSHTYLPCRILNLGDKTVSWVRNRDSYILTVDHYTFITDDRFTARFEAATQTWTLQIKFVSDDDAGSYECQLSTEPKMSRSVKLRVVHPAVTIPGGSELHVRSGSDVTVKCVIARAIQPPPYVFWYHESAQVLPGSGGTPHSTAFQTPLERVSPNTALAVLSIKGVTRQHAGNYTCAPAGLSHASVTLHVLNGEHPAAMQHGTQSTSAGSSGGGSSNSAAPAASGATTGVSWGAAAGVCSTNSLLLDTLCQSVLVLLTSCALTQGSVAALYAL